MTQQPVGVIPAFTAGDRLRKARELAGLDQEAFAEMLGVSRGTVSNYERSATEHRKPIVLRAWAAATNVSQEWLETGEGSPTPPTGPGVPATPQDALSRLAARKRARHAGVTLTPRYLCAA